MKEINSLDLAELGRKCCLYNGPKALKKARDRITEGGCCYFGVTRENDQLRLLFAEISEEDDLYHCMELMEKFRLYAEGEYSPPKTGLTSEQIMDLVCTGYGYTALLEPEEEMVHIYHLPKEADSPSKCVKKQALFHGFLESI